MYSPITPALMTINDFVKWARLGRTRTYEEIASGTLPTFKIGRRRYIKFVDAQAWLDLQIANDREAA